MLPEAAPTSLPETDLEPAYQRWLQQNVAAHRDPHLRAVTLSFKRPGQAPGDATGAQLDIAADLAERFSAGEARVTHDQNLLLPWVRVGELPALWQAARKAGAEAAAPVTGEDPGLLRRAAAGRGEELRRLGAVREAPHATG